MSMSDLSIHALSTYCAENTLKYLKGDTSDDQFCYELFRRAALASNDILFQEAYTAIYKQYYEIVFKQIGALSQQLSHTEVEDLTQDAFLRFIKHIRNPIFLKKSTVLGSAINFLKACAQSASIDYLRKKRILTFSEAQRLDEDGDESDIDDTITNTVLGDENEHQLPDDAAMLADLRHKIWVATQHHIKDQLDQIIIRVIFVEGKKPRDLATDYAEQFKNAAQASEKLRNLKDRMRRDKTLMTLLMEFVSFQ